MPQPSPAGMYSAHTHSRPDPIPRSGSPLAFNRRDRDRGNMVERPGTPPWSSYPRDTAPASQQHQQLTRPIKSSSAGGRSGQSSSSSSPQEDPTTPPRRPAKDLPGSSSSKPTSSSSEKLRTTDLYNIKRDPPPRQRTPPAAAPDREVATPRRTTIAMQSVNHPSPSREETTSRSRTGTITARVTTTRPVTETILDTRRPAKDKIQPTSSNNNIGDFIDRTNLSSEALARVNDLDRALAGVRFTSSAASSSASSSSGASTSSRRDSGTTTGGSSDFTDFLSDDSDYELQRQAEERAAQLQKARIERVDDKEFRDAQRGLERMGLTESMGLKPAPTVSTQQQQQQQQHRSTNVPLGRAPGGFTAGTNTPQYQTVYLGRYH